MLQILAFLHYIAALRNNKTDEIWGKKNILQSIEKSLNGFLTKQCTILTQMC